MEYIEDIILDIVTLLPQVFFCGWIFCNLIPMQHPFGFCMIYGVTNVLFHTIFLWILPLSLFAKSIIMLVLNLIIPALFYIRKWASAISLSAFLYIVLVFADMLTLTISQYFLEVPFYSSVRSLLAVFAPYMFYLRCIYLAVLTLFLIPLSFFWKQFHKQRMHYTLWLFPFLIFQCVMLALAEYTVILANQTSMPLILFLALVAVLSCLSMCTVLWIYLINNKQHLATLHYIELKSYQKSLQNQSDRVQETERQISCLREELKSKMENICFQLNLHHPEIAQTQIKCTAQFVKQYTSNLLCENNIVNAVMQSQSAHCKKCGIHLDAFLDLPQDICINGIELCSIFSNIMDNAIDACSLLPKEYRKIYIYATIKQGFLIIKETNPCLSHAEAPVKPSNHSGLGLGILEELAQRRNGEIRIDHSETEFCITLWLQIEPSKSKVLNSPCGKKKPTQNITMAFHDIAPTKTFLGILLGTQLSLSLLIFLCMRLSGQGYFSVFLIGAALLVGGLVSDTVLAIFFSHLKSGYAMQQRVKALECDLQAQESHYKEIERVTLHLQRVQHDINNHLQTTLALITAGNYSDAETHLKDLLATLK